MTRSIATFSSRSLCKLEQIRRSARKMWVFEKNLWSLVFEIGNPSLWIWPSKSRQICKIHLPQAGTYEAVNSWNWESSWLCEFRSPRPDGLSLSSSEWCFCVRKHIIFIKSLKTKLRRFRNQTGKTHASPGFGTPKTTISYSPSATTPLKRGLMTISALGCYSRKKSSHSQLVCSPLSICERSENAI